MEKEITLSEKLLLLAIRPEKGGIMMAAAYSLDTCLIGALLLELELAGNISLRDKRTEVIKATGLLPVHTYMLEKMARSDSHRRISHWLDPFVFSKKWIRKELYRSLSEKKQIRLEDKHFLFFSWKKPWLSVSNPTWGMIEAIKNLMYQYPGSPENLYLAALLEPAELWRRIYPEWTKRRNAKRKIREYMNNPPVQGVMVHAAESARVVTRAVKASVYAQHAASA